MEFLNQEYWFMDIYSSSHAIFCYGIQVHVSAIRIRTFFRVTAHWMYLQLRSQKESFNYSLVVYGSFSKWSLRFVFIDSVILILTICLIDILPSCNALISTIGYYKCFFIIVCGKLCNCEVHVLVHLHGRVSSKGVGGLYQL